MLKLIHLNPGVYLVPMQTKTLKVEFDLIDFNSFDLSGRQTHCSNILLPINKKLCW